MGDLVELSSRIIDSGLTDQAVNRVTNELSELADDLAIVESFSHSAAMRTSAGLVCFDSSGVHTGDAVVRALRAWSTDPVSHLVYTHGHADHVGGSVAFALDAERAGSAPPRVVGHEHLPARLDRYELTNDWNLIINARQFGTLPAEMGLGIGGSGARFLPVGTLRPDELVGDAGTLQVGDDEIELHHARGETDDHLWAYVPGRRWLFAGDFVIWHFPNAGNPQKVQRYPGEWAAALRAMAATDVELLVPAHGLPIAGHDRIAAVLDVTASALEQLVADVIGLMNTGATLDEVLHTVRVPDDVLAKPFLRPFYDEPEFVIRNVWRQYGGWWDGAASRLKPAPDTALAGALAELAGGPPVLAARAQQAVADGDLRLACHLADLAGWAAPDDAGVHGVRAEVYAARRAAETSLMAIGIYRAAERESEAVRDR